MSSGRVALLGDAAHSMTSFFGQGACQAIEDAAELSNVLSAYFADNKTPNSAAIQQTLENYRLPRENRAKDLVNFSASYAKVHTANYKIAFPILGEVNLGPMLRSLIFGYAPQWTWMRYLEWLYGYQPVVNGLGEGKCIVPKAGVQNGKGNLWPLQYQNQTA